MEQIKAWFKEQSTVTTVIIVLLTAIVGAFMTGLWMDLGSIKMEVYRLHCDLSTVKETLPKDYTLLVNYLQDKAIIRVHDEESQKFLQSIQMSLAVANQKMDALTETLKDYRREYRQDNPYVKEPDKKGRASIKHTDE